MAVCGICGKQAHHAIVVRGKAFVDGYGVSRFAKDSTYHRDCYRMQRKGLLFAGYDKPPKNSVGKRCAGCNTVIDDDDRHAHRNGAPYHKECLF